MAVLEKNQIITGEKFENKEALFKYVGKIALENGIIDSVDGFVEGLFEREHEMSTCFEDGIAIPHCRNASVKTAAIFIVRSMNAVEWDAQHNQADFIVLLAVPMGENDTHMNLLSCVARKLVDETFKKKILALTDAGELYLSFNEVITK